MTRLQPRTNFQIPYLEARPQKGLIQAFNAEDGRGKGLRATSGGELAQAISVALANHDGPTLIECVFDRNDCSPELISWGRQVAIANERVPRPQ
jgi:pyruvate decarboxylase